ncbi:inner membrane transporter RhtA [Sphingomonas zeicaulis]|uniref:EamA family transporter n=1 Tax=Sphingomonas zeicaulis TaxID=1632740 RepID=UPI003D1A7EAA
MIGMEGVAGPIALTILAMISIQTGASIAKHLFPIVGASGATAMRLAFAATILVLTTRPWRGGLRWADWKRALPYGLVLGAMNLSFYNALKTLPIGIAVALEFTGPLAVALFASRRPLDFVWIALAVAGLVVLLPITGAGRHVDPWGAAFALGAGLFWALYIIFGQKAGKDGAIRTVTLGTVVAALLVAPVGIVSAGAAMLTPAAIPLALGVAILSTALPYVLEMLAMTRLPAKTFGTLMSLEPAIGALSGLLLLGETLGVLQWGAIGAIVAASLGAALGAVRPVPPADPA